MTPSASLRGAQPFGTAVLQPLPLQHSQENGLIHRQLTRQCFTAHATLPPESRKANTAQVVSTRALPTSGGESCRASTQRQ
ncbi:hypothetical protein RHCRD62_20701 [Rhodococcus sp. RD6.2]|nr:hypothetical protein RHCRD62_20701 [Rhodococcus sp. RD6.2]